MIITGTTKINFMCCQSLLNSAFMPELNYFGLDGRSRNTLKHFSPLHLSGVSGRAHVLTAEAPPLSFITWGQNVLPWLVLLAFSSLIIHNTAKD